MSNFNDKLINLNYLKFNINFIKILPYLTQDLLA